MAGPVPGRLSTDTLVVRASDVHKSFGETRVLRGVDLEVGAYEFVALLGRSGGGKTTLLRILEGLDSNYDGEVLVSERRSVVFQDPRLLPWRKVWRNVVFGLKGSRAQLRQVALKALTEVGLDHRADVWPATLSGGEAQRAGLARALVRDPQLLLLDEPFGALDALTRLKMHALLRALIDRHRPGVVLITHDVQEALDLADRVVVLDGGRIVLDKRVREDREAQNILALEDLKLEILASLGVAEDH